MANPRYEPLDLLNRLNSRFEDFYRLPALYRDEDSNVITSNWTPAVDIREEDNAYVIRADIPGVEPDQIDISTENNVLTIRGEREVEKEEEKAGYRRFERSTGSFYRRFTLPDNADVDRIDAKSQHGVLELTIPKKQADKAKKVKVKA